MACNITRLLESAEKLAGATAAGHRPDLPGVAILGSFNSGKSTLINRLLEEDISPVGTLPTTSCLLRFNFGSTFKAKYYGNKEKPVFTERSHYIDFLTRVNTRSGVMEVNMPAPLLKKCRLLDTPGFDSAGESSVLAEQALRESDRIIYLFHQRGLDEANRLFLIKLARIWKGKNLNDISFWINRNLGHYDGTSLEATRAELRDIFLGQVRVNVINIHQDSDIATIRLCLEAELARETLRHTSAVLKNADRELPGRIGKLASVKNNALFLSEYWLVQETARTIIEAGSLGHRLPPAMQELDQKLEQLTAANLTLPLSKPAAPSRRTPGGSYNESKKNLLGFIDSITASHHLAAGFLDRAGLAGVRRLVEDERCTVAVTGGFSSGKSTFLNAVLREEILPAGDGPSTVAVTRLSRGESKKALVNVPMQVTLRLYDTLQDRVSLNRLEFLALQNWLSNPAAGAVSFAIPADGNDGRFISVNRQEITARLRLAAEIFCAGWTKGTTPGKPVPAAFKWLPLQRLKRNRLPAQVMVTFANYGTMSYDLEDPEGFKRFRLATGPSHAFRIERVDIRHPAELLKTADFFDTPGLDWVHPHHRARAFNYARSSDVCLYFLHAKHILNDIDQDNCAHLISLLTSADTGTRVDLEEGRVIFVINFADVLSQAQRESVANFVRKQLSGSGLVRPTGAACPRIFLISALQGLGGESGVELPRLLAALEDSLMKLRGRNFILRRLSDLGAVLEQAAQKIQEELNTGHSPSSDSVKRKKELFKSNEFIRTTRRRLKEMRHAMFYSGRL